MKLFIALFALGALMIVGAGRAQGRSGSKPGVTYTGGGTCIAYHFATREEVRFYEVHCTGTAMPVVSNMAKDFSRAKPPRDRKDTTVSDLRR